MSIAALIAAEKIIRHDPRLLPPSWQARAHWVPHDVVADPEIGFLLRPDQHDWIEAGDFRFLRTTDGRGFVNRDPWPTSAAIVLLGDSLLAGIGVGLEQTFARRIDDLLPDENVINLGVPGAGAERQYRIFRRFGVDLQPRLVVAGLYLASDLLNDDHFHNWLRDPEGLDYDPYRLSRGSREPLRRLTNLRLYGWLQSVVEPWLWGDLAIPYRLRVADGTELFFDRAKVQFAKGVAAAGGDQLARLFASLERLRTLVEGQGAWFAVMLIPSKEEIYAVSAEASAGNAVAEVRRGLDEAGIPFLDLYPILREQARTRSLYYPRDAHLNPEGHRIVAEAFVAWWRDHETSGLQSWSR